MVIQALPQSAIQSLGSGQALTDPVSLIKELIENSLDAQATKISIEVSQNVIDIVQVSDNGYGISPDDRQSACIRHCTSKIRTYEDVNNCSTLGFRGEALASAATLSEKLAFTTKVEGEKVATECEVGKDGHITSTKSTRAPVGTTIRVTGFLKTFPVRRQNAIKYAITNLKKLKKLIATYYLSRPKCRFSLKVLTPKGRTPTKTQGQESVYAPAKSLQAAVGAVIGAKIPASFHWVSTVESSDTGNSGIKIEAFLPKPDSDINQFSTNPTCTQYTYVDSRPVSCTRGTFKTIISLYRSYLKSSFRTTSILDPFIYLNIICPPDTYDPNVEPAKDDVLFQDPEAVVTTVESVFKDVYGELLTNEFERSVNKGKKAQNNGRHGGGFEVLLARRKETEKPSEEAHQTIQIENDEQGVSEQIMSNVTRKDLEGIDDVSPNGGLPHPQHGIPEGITLDSCPNFLSCKALTDHTGTPTQISIIPDNSNLKVNTDLGAIDLGPSPSKSRDRACVISEDDLPTPPPLPLPEEEDELIDEEANREIDRKYVTLSNPWTAARLNTPFNKLSPMCPPQMPSVSHRLQYSPNRRRHDLAVDLEMHRSDISPPSLLANVRTPRPPRNRDNSFGPFLSPPQSSSSRRTVQRAPALLEDPDNAGALDSFITRTPQSITRLVGRPDQASKSREKDKVSADVATDLLPPPPYSTQVLPVSPRLRRDFVSATTILNRNLDSEEDTDVLPPQRRTATHKKRRMSIEEVDDDKDLYSLSALSRNKQNPNQNRQNRATAALVVNPFPQVPISKRRRTKSLLPLEVAPPPQDQVVTVVQSIDFPLKEKSIEMMFNGTSKDNRLCISKAGEPNQFFANRLNLPELREVIIGWGKRLGVEEDDQGTWVIEETEEGWSRVSTQ